MMYVEGLAAYGRRAPQWCCSRLHPSRGCHSAEWERGWERGRGNKARGLDLTLVLILTLTLTLTQIEVGREALPGDGFPHMSRQAHPPQSGHGRMKKKSTTRRGLGPGWG